MNQSDEAHVYILTKVRTFWDFIVSAQNIPWNELPNEEVQRLTRIMTTVTGYIMAYQEILTAMGVDAEVFKPDKVRATTDTLLVETARVAHRYLAADMRDVLESRLAAALAPEDIQAIFPNVGPPITLDQMPPDPFAGMSVEEILNSED